MADKQLFEIQFRNMGMLMEAAKTCGLLLDANVKASVARTVIWGAGRIAEDAPIDTGRLRASILGYLQEKTGISLAGADAAAMAEGLGLSATQIDGYEGRIGTNVRYALPVEYGHKATGPKKLTPKQLRYLFASGILRSGPGGRAIPGTVSLIKGRKTYRGVDITINRRAGIVSRVKGKGMFRKNVPLIDRYFQNQVEMAIEYALAGKLLPISF
ncbi:MAG: hypothetical protein ACYCX4_02655 [Bacillota bacterium]